MNSARVASSPLRSGHWTSRMAVFFMAAPERETIVEKSESSDQTIGDQWIRERRVVGTPPWRIASLSSSRTKGLIFAGAGVGLRGGTVTGIIEIHAFGQLLALLLRSNPPNLATCDVASEREFAVRRLLCRAGSCQFE